MFLKLNISLNCEFVQASMGNNPSYIWRSIMVAQQLVRNGLHWQFGNGKYIWVCEDRRLRHLLIK